MIESRKQITVFATKWHQKFLPGYAGLKASFHLYEWLAPIILAVALAVGNCQRQNQRLPVGLALG
jgi:hypothetical protein